MTSAPVPAWLRDVRAAEPLSIGALVALVDRLLQPSAPPGERPTSERTVRFYVGQGIVRPPGGRGGSTMWGVEQVIDVLSARLAQRDGMALAAIAARHAGETPAVRERRVRAHLGEGAPVSPPLPAPVAGRAWQRLLVMDGCEVHLAETHPLYGAADRQAALAAHLRRWLDSAR